MRIEPAVEGHIEQIIEAMTLDEWVEHQSDIDKCHDESISSQPKTVRQMMNKLFKDAVTAFTVFDGNLPVVMAGSVADDSEQNDGFIWSVGSKSRYTNDLREFLRCSRSVLSDLSKDFARVGILVRDGDQEIATWLKHMNFEKYPDQRNGMTAYLLTI